MQARRQDLAVGGNNQEGPKTRRGATFLKYRIKIQKPGAKREMGRHRFQKGGPGTTGPPAGDDPDRMCSAHRRHLLPA